MVEAGLQQFRQVVVFSGADEARDVVAGQRTRARVQVVEQQTECFRVEFDNGKLGLGQFGTIHFLDIGAHAQARNGQRGAGRCSIRRRSSFTVSSVFFGCKQNSSIKFLQ